MNRRGELRMKDIDASAHAVALNGRRQALITGVHAEDSFNEQMIVLATSAGSLTLLGSGLNISSLNLEEGRLSVEGEVSALEYDERARAGGLLGRIFR